MIIRLLVRHLAGAPILDDCLLTASARIGHSQYAFIFGPKCLVAVMMPIHSCASCRLFASFIAMSSLLGIGLEYRANRRECKFHRSHISDGHTRYSYFAPSEMRLNIKYQELTLLTPIRRASTSPGSSYLLSVGVESFITFNRL